MRQFKFILRDISKYQMAPGMTERPKLKTVAEEAGVSMATVSQVLRGEGRISEATRRKVLSAAQKVNYVPNSRAASMRSGENREIGLLIHKIANPFNAEVISGVSDLLEQEGYLVSVLDTRDDPGRQQQNLEALIRNMRGGILWVPAVGTTEQTFELLETHRIPAVTFLRRMNGVGHMDHVGIENAAATRAATEYLAALGHKHIAFFGGWKDVDARTERIRGYKEVMAEKGLAEPLVWPCRDTKADGLAAALKLVEEHPEVTAIVCNGDMVAVGACLALHKLGLQPGKHLSIIGFDDVQDAALSTPPLTTVAVNPYELGRKLARVLLDRIREPDMPVVTVLVPTKLVVRESTGSPKAEA